MSSGGGKDNCAQSQIQIGGRCDDHAIVATKLQDTAPEAGRDDLRHGAHMGTEPVAEPTGICLWLSKLRPSFNHSLISVANDACPLFLDAHGIDEWIDGLSFKKVALV